MTMTQPDVVALWKELESRVAAGDRFAGLFATHSPASLSVHLATAGEVDTLEVTPRLPPGSARRSGTSG